MKRLLKKIMAFALAGVMAISVLGISAFAAATTTASGSTKPVATASSGTKIVSFSNAEDKIVGDKLKGTLCCSDGCFNIDKEGIYCKAAYSSLSADDKISHRQQALNKLGSAGFSSTALKKIESAFKNKGATEAELLTSLFANTKADLFTAMKWFSPFQGTIGLILGIGVILIILLLIASTAFDLVYIGLPMARNVMDGKAEQNNKPRPFGVSTDAVRVVTENEDNNKGTGGNMYVAYFKKRVVTYIILAICILYLVSGQLSSVIGWLLGQVSGIGS